MMGDAKKTKANDRTRKQDVEVGLNLCLFARDKVDVVTMVYVIFSGACGGQEDCKDPKMPIARETRKAGQT